VFGGNQLAILPNSAGSPDDLGFAEARRIEASLGLHVLRRTVKKPQGFDEVLSFLRTRDGAAGLQAFEIVMVGDRLLTDVAFGNAHGLFTVHTQPLSRSGDNAMAVIVRDAERLALAPLLRAIGATPPPNPIHSRFERRVSSSSSSP
jgi:phosphatidylglycerophosphatase GEP4